MENEEVIVAKNLEVKVYPQTTRNEFNIVISSKNASPILMEVFDELGRLVMKNNNVVNRSVYNFGGSFTSGVYYLRVVQGGEVEQLKIIKL